MKAYVIYRQDYMGYDGYTSYAVNYSVALQQFNNLVRKAMNEVYDSIDKEDFSEQVSNFKKYETERKLFEAETKIEIICRTCPFILYKREGKLIARVYSWEKCSYEYSEWDITTEEVILEEIELIEKIAI